MLFTTIEKLSRVGNVIALYLSEVMREDKHDLYGILSKNE
jgi:Holliday junction resolvasome RuvABC DNA-binding subunit